MFIQGSNADAYAVLLLPLGGCGVECAIHHKQNVREE